MVLLEILFLICSLALGFTLAILFFRLSLIVSIGRGARARLHVEVCFLQVFSSLYLTLLSFSHPHFILPHTLSTIFHHTYARSTHSQNLKEKHSSTYFHRRVATHRKLRKVSSRVPKKKKKSEKEKEKKERNEAKKKACPVREKDDAPENATCHC